MAKKNADLVQTMELLLESADRMLRFAKSAMKQQNTVNTRLNKLEAKTSDMFMRVRKLESGK